MTDVIRLKKGYAEGTFLFVLKNIFTAGIYNIFYLTKGMNLVNEILGSETIKASLLFQATMVLGVSVFIDTCAISMYEAWEMDAGALISGIGSLVALGASVYFIIIAFRIRKALQNYALEVLKIDYRLNGFLTFLFSLFYVNYKINCLEEELMRKKILDSEG